MSRQQGKKPCARFFFILAAVGSLCISSNLAQAAGSSMFQCPGPNGHPIPSTWLCDGGNDCDDGEDERNCGSGATCNEFQFTCRLNNTCIPQGWECDGFPDCWDGTDEENCAPRQCKSLEFLCDNSRCVWTAFRCDGDNDCGDNSDERNCPGQFQCQEHQFQCDSQECIPNNWECDGDIDCRDSSDEMDCGLIEYDCIFGMVNCTNGGCINANLVCDGSVDCLNDESDEEDCPELVCRTDEFKCPDAEVGCIPRQWVCDRENDCGDWSDEVNCVGHCTFDQYTCITDGCVNQTQVCDGIEDCKDGSDEFRCSYPPPPVQCHPSQFPCLDGRDCIGVEFLCDNKTHCSDGSDEHKIICAFSSYGVDECAVNNGGCEHSCHDTPYGYFCSCLHGYLLDPSDRRSCSDYNECGTPGMCSQLCYNTNGSYFCECVEGYTNSSTHGGCKAEGPPARLLFVNRVDIREVALNGSYSAKLSKNLHSAVAIDFHYQLGYIYWTDLSLDVIHRARMDGSNITTIINTGLQQPGGMAVDWVAGRLYWSDAEKDRIEVSDLEGNNRTVMFSSGLDRPRAIALDPIMGLMFWTDWGVDPKIERASMDGKQRTILHEKHLFWPNALTIDYPTHSLYWADSKLRVIESSHVDGSGRRLVIADAIRHPFAMTIFEDRLYWTDWETKSVLSTNKGIGKNITEVLGNLIQPMGIHAVHPVRQPEAPNPCAINNGNCSYLCLLSAEGSPGYSCACPTGIRLAPNGRDCQPLDTFILFARQTDIRRISLDVLQFIDVTLPLSNLSGALAVDWDSETDQIFWTDIAYDTINVAKIDGSGQHVLVSQNLKGPGGIAVDWVARKLYWTDVSTDRIEVSDLDGGNRSILVFGKLDKPRDIVVHPSAGLMFWTDWGRYPKIERAGLDGSIRTIIVETNLTFPNGLALDYDNHLIYWANAGQSSIIEYADFDGRNREILLSSNIRHPFGLALHGDWLYWTDWLSESVERANKTTGLQRSTLADNLDRPMDIHIFNRIRPQQQVLNPCSSNNGGCSHLCLTRPSKRHSGLLDAVCACPTGHNLMGDKRNCDPIINNYLLFPTLSDARQISLDVPYLADSVLSIPRLTAATSLDVDIVTDEVFWTDRLDAKIYKAPMNSNGAAVEVINTSLVSPESIAIDWIARNIYWVDSGTRRIEVATLNGTSRKVLFSTNVVLPTSIAVDLQSHTMFWTDAGDQTRNYLAKIEKATMDGSTRQAIITYTSQGGAPRAITIDNPRGLAGRIYWTDSYYMTIESANIHGEDRRQVLSLESIDSASPFGVAVFDDHIYWTDMNLRTVNRARKDSGTAVSVVWEGESDEQLAEIKVIKKIDLRNKATFDHPCDSDQGCSDLCLPNQSIQKYTCACPTGVTLLDAATCRRFPRLYLLIAARTTVRRISMEMQSYNDVILVSGLRNAIAIDFLLTSPEDGMMFCTDETKIYTANLDGTGKHEIVNSGLNNSEGLAVDWVAHNVYWTDTGLNRIEVARLDGSQRRVVVSTNLDEPRSLALHPHLGLMVWTDWGASPKIEKSNMDGSSREAMVTTGIKWPNGITIDYITTRVYWVDAFHNSLESININGNDRRLILSHDRHILHPFGVAVHAGFVFWSDWTNRSIFRADEDESGGVNLFRIQGNINRPMSIVFVNSLAARPGELTYFTRPGPCTFDNGGCNETHLCLALDSTRRRCACPDNTTSCLETVGIPPPPPSTAPPTTATPNPQSDTTRGPPPNTVTPPQNIPNLPPGPPTVGSTSRVSESLGTPAAIVLSTGILVTVIVISLIVVVSVTAIILIAAVYVKRQHDKQERRQRYQIVRQRSIQSLSFNKLNSSHATTVIQTRNNLIPQANNATVQKNKDGNANIKEQNIFVETPEVWEIPTSTRQKHHPSPPDSPPLKPPPSPPPKSNKPCDKPPAAPPPLSDEDCSAPPCLPPKGRPPVDTKSSGDAQKKDRTPTSEKTQNTSPPLPTPPLPVETKVQNIAPLENESPEKSPINLNYDHLEIEPSPQGIHKEYDHLELKESSDSEELPGAYSASGTESSSL